jgi:DNA-binding NarL/FixJ family response regulator
MGLQLMKYRAGTIGAVLRLAERQRRHLCIHIRSETMRPEKTTAAKARVLIVDDHPLTRAGLVYMINQEPDLIVCGEAENAAQTLNLLGSSQPDLLLLDLTLPGKSGLELIKDVKAMYPELPILVISMQDESLYVDRVLRAGARGYITKHEKSEKLMGAVRQVLRGKIYVSEHMSAHILEMFSGGHKTSERSAIEQLSDREFEVFELLGAGLSAHEIGKKLHLSAKTVDAHRANIKKKVKIKSGSELISYAARWIANQANAK